MFLSSSSSHNHQNLVLCPLVETLTHRLRITCFLPELQRSYITASYFLLYRMYQTGTSQMFIFSVLQEVCACLSLDWDQLESSLLPISADHEIVWHIKWWNVLKIFTTCSMNMPVSTYFTFIFLSTISTLTHGHQRECSNIKMHLK